MSKRILEELFPLESARPLPKGWVNGAKGWYIHQSSSGLYTLDIEHIPDEVVWQHNNPNSPQSVLKEYYKLCVHACDGCFNEDARAYAKEKKAVSADGSEKKVPNRMMSLKQTMEVIDQAQAIAQSEGHAFESVKFLGPGELLINPQLFDIIDAYQQRDIFLNIFTKGALLGSDELAQRYQGMSAKELTDRLAEQNNVGLLMSFQSFDHKVAERLVTRISKRDGSLKGLVGYGPIRNRAIKHIIASGFYQGTTENRFSVINAPLSPENIDESLEIYRFFTSRSVPVISTTSMVSGKGKGLLKELSTIQKQQAAWYHALIEFYAQVYAHNLKEGIQSPNQINNEGIASYAGAEPCNFVTFGLYIRANGDVQMCPGRNDEETRYGNVHNTPLAEIWRNSPNRQRGIDDPHNIINSHCPAKDGRAFPPDFYQRVKERLEEIIQE